MPEKGSGEGNLGFRGAIATAVFCLREPNAGSLFSGIFQSGTFRSHCVIVTLCPRKSPHGLGLELWDFEAVAK